MMCWETPTARIRFALAMKSGYAYQASISDRAFPAGFGVAIPLALQKLR
jgi:hypothetical protein